MNARSSFETHEIPRGNWLRYWSAADDAWRSATVSALIQHAEVIDVRHPRAGLALMQMRDSAMGDSFFIGELPWSRAHVQVRMPNGQVGEGAAEWMDDRAALARELAVLDAVLAHRLDGWEQAHALLLAGCERCRVIDAQRSAMLEATRVDFKRLEDSDE